MQYIFFRRGYVTKLRLRLLTIAQSGLAQSVKDRKNNTTQINSLNLCTLEQNFDYLAFRGFPLKSRAGFCPLQRDSLDGGALSGPGGTNAQNATILLLHFVEHQGLQLQVPGSAGLWRLYRVVIVVSFEQKTR